MHDRDPIRPSSSSNRFKQTFSVVTNDEALSTTLMIGILMLTMGVLIGVGVTFMAHHPGNTTDAGLILAFLMTITMGLLSLGGIVWLFSSLDSQRRWPLLILVMCLVAVLVVLDRFRVV